MSDPRSLLPAASAALALLLAATPAWSEDAPAKAPWRAQANSSIRYFDKEGVLAVETVNQTYALTGDHLSGRADKGERLVLRMRIATTEILGDKGVEGEVTVAAWTMGSDLNAKPLYSVSVAGLSARAAHNFLFFERGTDEVEWQSIYQLGTGKHLFDSAGPPVLFDIALDADSWSERVAGLYLPPDDDPDPRLKQAATVGVLTYAAPDSDAGILHELIVTHDDHDTVSSLRSYWTGEEGWHIAVSPEPREGGSAAEPRMTLSFFGIVGASLVIPIHQDDFDLEHAEVPPGFHLARWQR
jgi:hypothetical protein